MGSLADDEDPQDVGEDFNPEDEIEEIEDFDEANLENDIEEVEEEEEPQDEVDDDDDDDDEDDEQEEEEEMMMEEEEAEDVQEQRDKGKSKNSKKLLEVNTGKEEEESKMRRRLSKCSDQEGSSLDDEEDSEDLSTGSDRMDDDDDDDDDDEDEEGMEDLIDLNLGMKRLEEITKNPSIVNMSRKKNAPEDEGGFVDICTVDNNEPPLGGVANNNKVDEANIKKEPDDEDEATPDNNKENETNPDNPRDQTATVSTPLLLPKQEVREEDLVVAVAGAGAVAVAIAPNHQEEAKIEIEAGGGPSTIYRMDINSMTEERIKVIKERERRKEILFYYRALQNRLVKPGTSTKTELWPKQEILQKASDSIAALKQNDAKLEVELESEMQKNYVLKKKLRDQEILNTIKRLKVETFKAKPPGQETTAAVVNSKNAGSEEGMKKLFLQPSRTIILKKLGPGQVSATKLSDTAMMKGGEAAEQSSSSSSPKKKVGSFIVKIKQEPQEEQEAENGDMEKELAAATRAVMTAITPTVVDESDAKVRGETLTPRKLGSLDRTSREAEIMAAIKKLKGTISSGGPGGKKIIVAIPSKLREEEEPEAAGPVGRKRPKGASPNKPNERPKVKGEDVVEIMEDEDEVAPEKEGQGTSKQSEVEVQASKSKEDQGQTEQTENEYQRKTKKGDKEDNQQKNKQVENVQQENSEQVEKDDQSKTDKEDQGIIREEEDRGKNQQADEEDQSMSQCVKKEGESQKAEKKDPEEADVVKPPEPEQ